MHNIPTAGHFSTNTIFEKIRSRYYWSQMYKNIRKYTRSCDACQRRGKSQIQSELHSIKVNTLFYQIGIDFIEPLLRTTQENRYIIVAMDYLIKWSKAKVISNATAEETEKFIYEDIIY